MAPFPIGAHSFALPSHRISPMKRNRLIIEWAQYIAKFVYM